MKLSQQNFHHTLKMLKIVIPWEKLIWGLQKNYFAGIYSLHTGRVHVRSYWLRFAENYSWWITFGVWCSPSLPLIKIQFKEREFLYFCREHEQSDVDSRSHSCRDERETQKMKSAKYTICVVVPAQFCNLRFSLVEITLSLVPVERLIPFVAKVYRLSS